MKGASYGTLSFWVESISKLEGDFDTYVYLNDLPSADLQRARRILKAAGMRCEHKTYHHPVDCRQKRRISSENLLPYKRFSIIRNHILEYAADYDYLFSVDSDVLCRPNALKKLLELQKQTGAVLISLLVNNTVRYGRFGKDAIYNYGQVRPTFLGTRGAKIIEDKCIPCEYTGACCLINLQFIREHGIKYTPSEHGEDIGFCEEIIKHKGKVMVYTGRMQECFHIQDPWIIGRIQSFMKGKFPYKV
jgi:hypothetical protein